MTPPESPADPFAVLGVPPGAPPAAARAAFLSRLRADDFRPSEEAVAAVNRLIGTTAPVADPGIAVAEEEAFAAAFWGLATDARLARWSALADRVHYLSPRLLALEPGLDAPVSGFPDPLADEMAGLVRELFVLPPRARAVRRAEWLSGKAEQFTELTTASKRLQTEAPAVARLDPPLFALCGHPITPISGVVAAPIKPAAVPAFPDRKTITRRAKRRTPSTDEWVSKVIIKMIWLVLGSTTILIGRAMILYDPARDLRSPSVPARPTPPSLALPESLVMEERHYTPKDLAAYRQYEQDHPQGGGTPPDGYSTWVSLGRPEGVHYRLVTPEPRTLPTARGGRP